ncbi:MAG: HlyD family efflux transporter periplasmic adaptor subunit, partial [Anaerolineales bacterium]|nr:HlyD family efflux transporter periplasmic adaptor subunit [Anaerolineales bacterium]
GATPAQVDLAEVGVAQAEVAVAQAEVAVQQAAAAVAAAEAEVAAAQVGLDTADAALAKLTLTAGLAGRVARIDVSSGELVAAGTPVITLADDSAWQVTTSDLTELDVAAIAVGETAVVTLEAIPGVSLSGTVTEVALTPGQSQGDVVYAVTVALPPAPDLPLRWGMTAFVDVDV